MCATPDECEALKRKTTTEFISDLSNLEISRQMKDKENWKGDLEKIKLQKSLGGCHCVSRCSYKRSQRGL